MFKIGDKIIITKTPRYIGAEGFFIKSQVIKIGDKLIIADIDEDNDCSFVRCEGACNIKCLELEAGTAKDYNLFCLNNPPQSQ